MCVAAGTPEVSVIGRTTGTPDMQRQHQATVSTITKVETEPTRTLLHDVIAWTETPVLKAILDTKDEIAAAHAEAIWQDEYREYLISIGEIKPNVVVYPETFWINYRGPRVMGAVNGRRWVLCGICHDPQCLLSHPVND